MEVRERGVRLVREHEGECPSQWAAITSIATECGMPPKMLRRPVARQEAPTSGRRRQFMAIGVLTPHKP